MEDLSKNRNCTGKRSFNLIDDKYQCSNSSIFQEIQPFYTYNLWYVRLIKCSIVKFGQYIIENWIFANNSLNSEMTKLTTLTKSFEQWRLIEGLRSTYIQGSRQYRGMICTLSYRNCGTVSGGRTKGTLSTFILCSLLQTKSIPHREKL